MDSDGWGGVGASWSSVAVLWCFRFRDGREEGPVAVGEEGEEGEWSAKRVNAARISASVEADMRFWRASAEGGGWVDGADDDGGGSGGWGGAPAGHRRLGGCGERGGGVREGLFLVCFFWASARGEGGGSTGGKIVG